MSNLIVFESLFVFVVWMQRKGRWKIFWDAAGGKYTVAGSARSGSQVFSYTPANDGSVQASGASTPATGATPQTPNLTIIPQSLQTPPTQQQPNIYSGLGSIQGTVV